MDTSDEYAEAVLHAYNPFNWSGAAGRMINRHTEFYLYSHWHPFFAPAQKRVIGRIRKINRNVRSVGLIHNVLPHDRFPFQCRITRKLLQATDYPVLLSAQTEQQFRRILPGKPYLKLFHPVYEQPWPSEARHVIRRRLGFGEDEVVVIFFGLIRPYKGLDVLIEALNLINLEKRRIRPLIVGEFYVEPNTILSKIKKTHLPYFEVVNRFVDDREAAMYLYASDLMVLPYKSASQSGVLSNALNFNLPVIASDLPGLAEQVKHGSTGYLFEPGDFIGLAKYLCDAANHAKITEMRHQVTRLRSDLSWDRFARELIASIRF